jgi:hypothetical protein
MENTYKSIGFAPYWFFGGFRDVAVGAIVYHEVLSPFSLADALRTFVTPQAGRLAREQQRLRERQDENRRALASAIGRAADWSRLAESNAWLNRRLGEIREEHRIEVQRVTGSKAQWRSHQREFRAMVRALARTGILPVELEETFSQFEPGETLSARVLQHMDVHGAFSVGELGPGPWLSLTGRDGQRGATGLSRAEVLSGDPEVAVLVLAAAIDYQLYQPSMRRIDIAEVNELFRLFSEAAASTGERRPSGVMRAKRSGP